MFKIKIKKKERKKHGTFFSYPRGHFNSNLKVRKNDIGNYVKFKYFLM